MMTPFDQPLGAKYTVAFYGPARIFAILGKRKGWGICDERGKIVAAFARMDSADRACARMNNLFAAAVDE